MNRSLSPAPVEHRGDIDGLRAFAVLGVVFYHFNLPGLSISGGFTGVDVFLVISGFLITQILVRDCDQPGYLKSFISRRFRRIFPALITVIGVSLGAGYFLLTSTDYVALGEQSRAATFALSNFYFLANTGYFDPAAEIQPLLHTWSLAVEEQFYLVWPLIILCFARWGRPTLLGVSLTIVATSLWYSEVLAVNTPTEAFYAPWSRAWELGVGATLALLPRFSIAPTMALVLRITGCLLVGLSFFWLSKDDVFPGLNAAYACVGTALLVLPVQEKTSICKLLSARPLQAIGLISYSLYLWHWPILVYYQHYQNTAAVSLAPGLLLIALSIGLATASYYLIEKPFRYGQFSRATNQLAGFGSTMAVLVFALIVVQTDGLKSRFSERSQLLSDKDAAWEWQPSATPNLPSGLQHAIAFGSSWSTAAYRVLIWGDSHAEHISPIIERALNNSHPNYAAILYNDCPIIIDNQRVREPTKGDAYNDYCGTRRSAMFEFLTNTEAKPDVIVLASAWYSIARRINTNELGRSEHVVSNALTEVAQRLTNISQQVAVIGQIPIWDVDPIPCQVAVEGGILRTGCETLGEHLLPLYSEQNTRLNALAKGNVKVIVPGQQLCRNGTCLTHMHGEFLYRDKGHLRRNLPASVKDQLAEQLEIESLFRTQQAR